MDHSSTSPVGFSNGGDVMSAPMCDQCTLKGPKVLADGNKTNPVVVFVGEAPGFHEVQGGCPFIGPAGKIIRRVVSYVGLTNSQICYTNLCLCRPPENRDPSAAEIKSCWPRLEAELTALKPQIIVALGAIPGRTLFPGKTLGNDSGRIMDSTIGTPGLITYHPAAMLYPKGSVLFPFVVKDLEKVVRYITGKRLSPELSNPETDVVVIDSVGLMQELIARLNKLPDNTLISFDWETTGTIPQRDIGYCLGLSWAPGTGITIPHKFIRPYTKKLSEALRRHRLTGYNAGLFDVKFNRRIGLDVPLYHDAMLMHYALDERPQRRSLENVTNQELDAPAYEAEMLAKYGCSKADMMTEVPDDVIYIYCGKDADWSLRLTKLLEERLLETPKLNIMYRSLLIPGADAFSKIQEHGIWVDRDRLNEVSERYLTEAERLEQELQQSVGREDFNPRSHKQVQEHLWDTLELYEPQLYGRKPRSADAETLEAVIESYPDEEFPQLLKDYRSVYTLYSRYLRGMDEYIHPDGRIRTQYHLDRTETGRLSTTNPALHQTPRDSDIRTIFAAPPGYKLIQADYSQVEMRMAAHCANDSELAQLFQELEAQGADFHTFMASRAFKTPIDEVTKDQRQAAKTVSFGILYRMSVKGLAVRIGTTQKEALGVIQGYEGLMPGVVAWIRRTEGQIRGQGYVESIFGRRRRFPFITDNNIAELKREAVNFPIQSAASDLTLTKVIELNNIFRKFFPEVGIVLMVHDEIVVECPDPLVDIISPLMKRTMETPPFDTDIPFPVEVNIGSRWGEGELYEEEEE